MRPSSHRSARSPHEFRRWVRLSVATVTSTALVGGAVVAVPPHPLNPLTQVAQAQETNTLLPADVSTAEGTLIDLALLAESGAIDEEGLELLEAIQSEQAWPQNAGEGADTGAINLELLQALNLNLGGITLPLVNDGTNGGLLELGSDGVGALNSYANAPGVEDVRAAAGAVTQDGALNLNPTTGEGSLDTTVHLTALTEQLGLAGITDLAVNELSLTVSALASTVEKNGDTVDPQYNAATAQLTIGSDLVGDISTELQNTVTELETGVNDLLGGEGVINSLLGVLGPVLNLVGIDDPEITASVDLQDTLDALLFEPLYEGATPEESLVNIDLTSGEILVNLEQLHDGDLSNLPADTELVSAAQLEEITQTVNELLGTLTDRISDALNEGLLDTQLTITLPDVTLLVVPLGDITIDATLGGLLGAEGHAEPVIDGDGVLGAVGGLLDALVGVLQPIGGVIQGALEGPVDELVDTLLGTDGPVTSLLDGLSPLIDGVLGDVVSATVNSQTELENGLRVSALDVSLLNLGGAELASLPLATSTVTSPSQAQIDDEVFAPTITSLDPNFGAIAGGESVTIEGDNLVSIDPETNEPVSAVTEVNFGDAVVTVDGITANADGSITVTTPAVETPGEVDVTVETAAGISNAETFTYTEDGSDPSVVRVDGTANVLDPTDTEQDSGLTLVNAGDNTETALVDEDDQVIEYRIDETTGQIFITPGENVDGPLTLTVTDPSLDASIEINIDITDHTEGEDDNASDDTTAPSFDPITPITGTVGEPIDPVTITTDDPDATLSIDEELPAGLVFDPETNQITGTPEEAFDGAITVTATDAAGNSTTADIPVTITPADDGSDQAPSFGGEANPVDPIDEEQDTGLDLNNPGDGTEIRAEDEDGDDIPVRVDEDGSILVTPGEDVDGPITIIVDDPALDESIRAEVPVTGHEEDRDDDNDGNPAEDGLIVNGDTVPVEATDDEQPTGLSLENYDDTTVTAIDEDDAPVSNARIDDDGDIVITPGADVDGPITLTITDDSLPNGEVVYIVEVIDHSAGEDDNNDGNPGDADAPSIGGTPNEVQPTDEWQDTGLDLNDETDDTTVRAEDEDGQDIDVDTDDDGNISVRPGEDVDGPITVIVDDPALDEPIEAEVPVAGHEEGRDDNNDGNPDDEAPIDDAPSIDGEVNPVNPTDEWQDTGLNLNDETDDTTIRAEDEDGQDIDVDDDGTISVRPGEDVDGPITVIVDDPALDDSIEAEVPVIGHLPGVDDNNSANLDTDLEVGSSGSWISNLGGLFVGLLGLGGIFAGIMEFMHQNGLLGQAEDFWWLDLTGRDRGQSTANH